MGNAFNNYFAKVAINIQSSNLFFFFLQEEILWLPPAFEYWIIFITPIDSTEASNIISFLNLDKCDGPNSIPKRILKLSNRDISDQLVFLFNQSSPSELNSLQFWKPAKLYQYTKKAKKKKKNIQPIDQFFTL